VPGCGRGAPPAGAGSQLGPNRSPEGLVGPRARCGKKRGGQGYLLIRRLDIRAKGAPTGLCSAPCIFYSCCPILRGPSGSQRRRGGRVLVPRRQSQTTGLGRRRKTGYVHLVLWRTQRCIGSSLCIKIVLPPPSGVLIALLLYLAAPLLRSDSPTAFPAPAFSSQVAKAKAEAIGQEGSP
jgi:hypothetical protein